MTGLDDCFTEGNLRNVTPSEGKAIESLEVARAYLQEARQVLPAGNPRLATSGVYMAWSHAARAVLLRDGVRERTHYCVEQYLSTYVVSGKLDPKWVTMLE
ncbi:MAG: HEPN domain-containing protein, partial [Methanoregulaceae archaeon]|nr:HEPN domain-containing protein [Methanoregulaceae archaeon]